MEPFGRPGSRRPPLTRREPDPTLAVCRATGVEKADLRYEHAGYGPLDLESRAGRNPPFGSKSRAEPAEPKKKARLHLVERNWAEYNSEED